MSENRIISHTNTVENAITISHQSTGTPASGFGVAAIFEGFQKLKMAIGAKLNFKAETSTTQDRDIGQISFEWNIATDANRTSHCVISVVKERRLVEVCRIDEEGRIGVRDDDNNLHWINIKEI